MYGRLYEVFRLWCCESAVKAVRRRLLQLLRRAENSIIHLKLCMNAYS